MKTAEEWMTERLADPTPYNPVELDTAWLKHIKQIQLDAFKAGMTEAAKCSNVIC